MELVGPFYFSIVSDVQTDGDTISFNLNLPDDMDTAANSLIDDESSTATITTEGGRGSTHKSENTGRRGGPSDAASRDPPSSKEKPRRSKRRTELPKPDYKEYDEPSEDSFIYCHLCNDLKIGPCQEEGHCLKITHYSSFQAREAEVFMHWLSQALCRFAVLRSKYKEPLLHCTTQVRE